MAHDNNISVRIRMYRQGLGDCFLLTFIRPGKDNFNMMIDCGLLQGTSNGTEIMQAVVADIEDALTIEKEVGDVKGKFLDVVVMTHEHADHISGFTQAKPVFDRIHFGEVWAGWVDDEKHPKYKAVRDYFKKQIAGLRAATAEIDREIARLSAASQTGKLNDLQSLRETVNSLASEFFEEDVFQAAADGGHSKSWNYAIEKSIADTKYFSPGKVFSPIEGVRIYVLGPPEDFKTFTQVDPPADETYREEKTKNFALADSFFAAVDPNNADFNAELYQPFESHLRINEKTAAREQFFKTQYGFKAGEENEWRRIDADWLNAAGGLALNLDNFTNNTCLALAIEFVKSGKILLFPGDAQFANWISWQKVTWDVPDGIGGKRKIKIAELLDNTVFYKVGHHGSHNATLKTHGLAMMNNSELAAMIPVDTKKAKSKTSKTNPNGWEMPEKNLYAKLLEKTRGRVVVADEKSNTELKKRCKDKKFVNDIKFGGSFVRDPDASPKTEPLYIEFTIKG